MYSQVLLDQIKERLPLSDVVGKTVPLKKKGNEYHGLCPFHNEKTPSFTVNNLKGFYHCFGCAAHGSVFDFLIFQNNYTFVEAVKVAAEITGITLPSLQDSTSPKEKEERDVLFSICEEAANYFRAQLKSIDGSDARDYLVKKRGISEAVLSHFQVGWANGERTSLKTHLIKKGFSESDILKAGLLSQPDTGESYDKFRKRIMFPITDRRGRIIAFGGRILGTGEPKYLNSPETPIFHKGYVLYNWSNAQQSSQKSDEVIVVEGYMDAISLHDQGYERVVAPLGTALTEHHITSLWRLTPHPLLCFDGDQAGARAAHRAAERALPHLKPGHTLSFVTLPYKEDPDTYVQKNGLTKFKDLLSSPLSLCDLIWKTVTENVRDKTPENRALVEAKLEDLTGQMNDPKVKSYYKQEFKDRLFNWTHKKKSSRPSKSFTKMNRTHIQEGILLKILIDHPHLLPQVEEALSTLPFQDKTYQTISELLLSYISDNLSLEKEVLTSYLVDKDQSVSVQELRAPGWEVHAPFISSKEDGVLLASWHSISAALLSKKSATDDLSAAKERLQESLTSEEWERFKSLKKALTTPEDEKDV